MRTYRADSVDPVVINLGPMSTARWVSERTAVFILTLCEMRDENSNINKRIALYVRYPICPPLPGFISTYHPHLPRPPPPCLILPPSCTLALLPYPSLHSPPKPGQSKDSIYLACILICPHLNCPSLTILQFFPGTRPAVVIGTASCMIQNA